MKSSEAVRRGWDIVAFATRLLGMRGDINRPEVRRFVPILRRHAMRVDPAAYRSLRMGPRADLLTAPAELAALVRRSRGFQKEFDAAEARRFKKDDLPKLEKFRKQVRDVVDGALGSVDPEVCKVALDRLREIGERIHVPHPTQGTRWGREGHAALDSAVREVEDHGARIHPAARLERIAADVTQIKSNQVSAQQRRSAHARRMAMKRRGPRYDTDIDRESLMRAIHRRRMHDKCMIKTAVLGVMEDYRKKGRPLSVKWETLRKQYKARLDRRTD
ncbi:MAG: hypothetical protein FJ280_18075 [Planctomycetes bacterium]|nr:hypothetical protein [Planctomycetota bacterium]